MTEAHHQLPSTINPINFPAKLWRMVNNPANSAIYWDNSGEVIVIDQLLFEQLVLSPNNEDHDENFKTTHFSSFVRQLNLYGFRKADSVCTTNLVKTLVTSSERNVIHHFYNPNFRRNNPELLANLKRLTVDNKAKIDSGIDVKCRPPSKNQRTVCGEANGLEKRLMRGGSSSFVRERKDSPHPYRKLSMGPCSGTLVPPHHFPPIGHPFTTRLFTPHQHAVRCGINYGTPNFTGIQNERYHPAFYSPAIQCYPPPLMSMPHRMQTGSFMPFGYFPACYPLMNLGSNDQRSDTMNKINEGIKKADINLETVFQIADEVMKTQPNNNLIKILVPEKESTSDDHSVVSDPVQIPKEALTEDTKEVLVKTEMTQVEICNTCDSESCQV